MPIRSFPGTLACGIEPDNPWPRKGGIRTLVAPMRRSVRGRNGSDMDIDELNHGSTIFVPMFQEGRLIWTNDWRCPQGNGEMNLAAMECSVVRSKSSPSCTTR